MGGRKEGKTYILFVFRDIIYLNNFGLFCKGDQYSIQIAKRLLHEGFENLLVPEKVSVSLVFEHSENREDQVIQNEDMSIC